MGCADDVPSGGEGRVGDGWLGNEHAYAVVRRPLAGAMSDASLDGGTIVDWATWGQPDVVREIIPLVDGRWLRADTFERDGSSWVIQGATDRVGGLDGGGLDQPAEVRWRVDGDRLIADGADALLLRLRGRHAIQDRHVVIGDQAIGLPEGVVAHPSLLIAAGDTLILGAVPDVQQQVWVGGTPVSGVAEEAEHVDVFAGERRIGRLAVVDGRFGGVVPPYATDLRAVGEARTSERVGPSAGLTLILGRTGRVDIDIIDDPGLPRLARWSGGTGPATAAIDPGGGIVDTGPGPIRLTVGGETVELDVAPGGVASASFDLRDPVPLARVDLEVAGNRGDGWVGTDLDALIASADRGAVWTVVVGDNDVSTGALQAIPALGHQPGVRVQTDDGVALVAWPYQADPRLAGHGAPDVRGLALDDAIAALSPRGRQVLIPLSALAATDPTRSRPTHVRLTSPADDFSNWNPWFERISDDGTPFPVGPGTWLAGGASEGKAAEAEVVRGTLVAGTSPVLTLTAYGVTAGEVAHLPDGDAYADLAQVEVTVHERGGADEAVLIGDGAIRARLAISEAGTVAVTLERPPGWLIAVLRGPTPDTWATTAPLRFARP